MARVNQTAVDFQLVSSLIVSDAYCMACIARKARIPLERVVASFRHIEDEWREPVIDTARCSACKAMTTVYSLRIP